MLCAVLQRLHGVVRKVWCSPCSRNPESLHWHGETVLHVQAARFFSQAHVRGNDTRSEKPRMCPFMSVLEGEFYLHLLSRLKLTFSPLIRNWYLHGFIQLLHPNTKASKLKRWLLSVVNRKATQRKFLLMGYRCAQILTWMYFQVVPLGARSQISQSRARFSFGKRISE